jgi:hypothetical protein
MTLVTRPAMSDDGGTFTTGTVVDEAFIDDLLDEVDDQAHSTTNPTIKPKATTDEVVTARGSKLSLDARLDVSLEEDGTLKTQASLVTLSQVQSALGSRNVALNGDLADWTNGGALAPDNFTLTGAAAVIARTGLAMVDTFHFGTGSGYAAKITRVGNDWKLTQDVIAAADFSKFTNVLSQKVSVAIKGKTGLASHLRIVVDDGVSTTASSYHTGGATEEHLTATHTISLSATKLSVYVEGLSSNGDSYIGGLMVVFADIAPSDWSAYSIVGDATATSKGQVNLSNQDMGLGIKHFSKPMTFYPGTQTTNKAKAVGRLTTNYTTVGNTGAGPDDLMTYTLKGGTLDEDGDVLRITADLVSAATASNKSIFFVFGGTTFNLLVTVGDNAIRYWVDIEIIRTGAATQRVNVRMPNNSVTYFRAAINAVTAAETLANDIILKFTASNAGGAANGIVQNSMIVEVLG